MQPVRPQPAELVVAADQRGRSCRVELRRKLRDRRLDVECGVLAQDRVVQAAELGRRLDADLVDQSPPRVAIGLERLGLPPAPVQREHPLPVEPLAERVLRQQRIDLADDLLMAARSQVGLDRQLLGGQAQLLEPPDLGHRERLVGDIRQRIAAKQRERLASRSVRRPAVLCRPGRLGDEPLEAADVHELAVDPQLVPAPAGEDLGAAVVGQHLAQAPDVVLHHLGGAGGRVVSPQPFDQPVGGDRAIRLETEHGKDGALLRSAEGDRAVVDGGLEVSKDVEPHAAARVRMLVSDQPNHLLNGGAMNCGPGPGGSRRPVYGWSMPPDYCAA